MNSEAKNTNEFLIAAGKIKGLVVFRNNCRTCRDETTGQLLFFGIGGPTQTNREGLGGSDFIGWYMGRFCAFEIKADKDNTKKERLAKQEHFISMVVNDGGYAGFVKRPIDILLILSGQGCTILKNYPISHLQQ